MARGRRPRNYDFMKEHLRQIREYRQGNRRTKPRVRRSSLTKRRQFIPPSFDPDPNSPSVDAIEGELVTPYRKWPEPNHLEWYLRNERVDEESEVPTLEYVMHSVLDLTEDVYTIIHSNSLVSLYPKLSELSWYLRCCSHHQEQFDTIDFLFKTETGYLPHYVRPSSNVLAHKSFTRAALFAGKWLCDQSHRRFSSIVVNYEAEWVSVRRMTKELLAHQTRVKVLIREDVAESLRKEFEDIDLGSLMLGVRKELALLGNESREAQAYKLFMPGNLTDAQVFERIAAMARDRPQLGWSVPVGLTKYQNLRRATERWAIARCMTPLTKRPRNEKRSSTKTKKGRPASSLKAKRTKGTKKQTPRKIAR